MNDLISREAAIQAVNRYDYRGFTIEDVKKVTDGCADELRKLPSIEAKPVLLGRWIPCNKASTIDAEGEKQEVLTEASQIIAILYEEAAWAYKNGLDAPITKGDTLSDGVYLAKALSTIAQNTMEVKADEDT